ncbi:MAG TPA: amidohydrolase, partial [Xanthomonadales bacterium]|nr:amidohydrolase [Xanthomonadales bacterium]
MGFVVQITTSPAIEVVMMHPLKVLLIGLFASLSLFACKPSAESEPATDAAGELAETSPHEGVRPPPPPFDLLIRDAAVYTVNPAQPWAEAVAISNGRIAFVGKLADAEARVGPKTMVISQPGGMVLPGFQDAHLHPYTSGIDQFDCNMDLQPYEPETYVAKAKECYETMTDREWIKGGGWNLTAFGANPIPNKALLDAVIPDKPAIFYSSDGHTAWVNSVALREAGITSETPDPTNGRIDRDPVTGEPVGSLQESAMHLVGKLVPPPPEKQRKDAMRYALDYLHSLGITGMQEAYVSVDPEDPLHGLETYRDFADRDQLKMRTALSLRWESDKGLEQIHDILAAREKYNGNGLRVNTVKMFLDGVVEPSTAALLQDYADQPGYKGELQIPQETLNEAVQRLDAEDFQVHIHVIGDAAVRAALDAFEYARYSNGGGNNRHHLAHAQFIAPEDLTRFAALDVTGTFSAIWAGGEDEFLTELTLPRVGPERYRWTYPMESLIKAGGRVAFGSDWNVSSPDPLQAIEAAVTRGNVFDPSIPVFMPQERISLEDAIKAATLNAAYVNHFDGISGSIEPGKSGDLVILDRNLFEIDPAE